MHQNAIELMAKTMKFLARMLTAFLRRQRPVSSVANPAFIQKTSMPAISVQTVLATKLVLSTLAIASAAVGGAAAAASWAKAIDEIARDASTASAISAHLRRYRFEKTRDAILHLIKKSPIEAERPASTAVPIEVGHVPAPALPQLAHNNCHAIAESAGAAEKS